MDNNRILKWSVDGTLSTFLQPAGRSNGMYFDVRGNLLACADEKTELWSIAPDGRTLFVADIRAVYRSARILQIGTSICAVLSRRSPLASE